MRAIRPRPSIVREHPCRVAAAGVYELELRDAIIAWKERGRLSLERPLGHLLAAAVLTLEPAGSVTLVPVPSPRERRRMRGADVVHDVACVAARLLVSAGVGASVTRAIGVTGRVLDQAGLTAAQRRQNMPGAFGAARSQRRLPSGPVIIVDDVATTGATLSEAVRALAVPGVGVLGAAVIAHRPGPSRASE